MPESIRPTPQPNTTFLQFVTERLLGPPVKRTSPGEAYWHCPFHNDTTPSFHTLPSKEGMRNRWKCFGCNAWGDEFDLLRRLRDMGDSRCIGGWADHEELLAQWRDEWESNYPRSTEEKSMSGACPACGASSFSSVERGVNPLTDGIGYSADPFDVEAAYRDATPKVAASLAQAFVYARDMRVDVAALVRFAYQQELEWARWLKDIDQVNEKN